MSDSSPADATVIWLTPESPERPTRGPQASHSRAEIVASAIALADEQGIDAVSMRRVATAIGAGTMSLYRYVPRKQDLIDLMVDAAWSELPLADNAEPDWRAAVQEVATQMRAVLHRHPWLATSRVGASTYGPNTLRFIEYLLGAVEPLGLSAGERMGAVQQLTVFVEGFVANELRERETTKQSGLTEQQRWLAQVPYLTSVIESGRYPRFADLIVHGDPSSADVQFTDGVRLLLDGLAARAGRR